MHDVMFLQKLQIKMLNCVHVCLEPTCQIATTFNLFTMETSTLGLTNSIPYSHESRPKVHVVYEAKLQSNGDALKTSETQLVNMRKKLSFQNLRGLQRKSWSRLVSSDNPNYHIFHVSSAYPSSEIATRIYKYFYVICMKVSR